MNEPHGLKIRVSPVQFWPWTPRFSIKQASERIPRESTESIASLLDRYGIGTALPAQVRVALFERARRTAL